MRFADELPEGSPFAPREVIAAKLRGLKRNAAVVLSNTGTMEDVPVLGQAIDDSEPLVREHLEWAMESIEIGSGTRAYRHPFAMSGASGNFPRLARRTKSVTVRKLRDTPDSGLSGSTTPLEQLALVEVLTREAWLLTGLDVPAYTRQEAPVSVRPLRTASSTATQ